MDISIPWRPKQEFRPITKASMLNSGRLQEFSRSFTVPETSYRLSQNAVLTKKGTIGFKSGEIIRETVPFHSNLEDLKNAYCTLSKVSTNSLSLKTIVCSLVDFRDFHYNYFHWFFDILPRVFACNHFENIFRRSVNYVVPHPLKEWQAATLASLNVSIDQMICQSTLPTNELYVDWLVSASTHRNPIGESIPFDTISPFEIHQMHKIFSPKKSSVSVKAKSKKLFVTRLSANTRRAFVSPALVDKLRDKGFEFIDFSGISFNQQCEIFSVAEHIIAIHGSALTNTLFSNAGTSVLEIFSDRHGVRPDYLQIASALNLDYEYIIAKSTNHAADVRLCEVDLDDYISKVQ